MLPANQVDVTPVDTWKDTTCCRRTDRRGKVVNGLFGPTHPVA